MATSGQIQTTTSFGYVRLAWSTSSQSVTNNTSTISYTLSIYRSSSISSTASKDYSVKINGITAASGTTTIGGSGTKTIKTGTTTISHNSDGTKTFNLSFSLEVAITWSGSYIDTITGSGTGTLDTIPRATTPTLSASSATMGNAITITTSRASSSFTHNLTYKIGSITGTIASGVATSYSWTIPLSLANAIPNATSGVVTITCKTYNGSTLIGTKTATFTANVPENVVPSCSVAVSEGVSGLNAKFGAYIQSKSKLKVVVTAGGSYSSTIKSYKTTINGVSYTSNSFTSNTLSKSGSIAITTIVTDTRGRTKTITTNINVLAYTAPTIKKFVCNRANSAGTANDEGTYLNASVNFTITSLNSLNDKTYTLQYKLKSATEWTNVASGSIYSFNSNILSSSGLLNANSSYDIRISVKDYFSTTYAYFDIGTAFTIIDFNENGQALAFGKVSEKESGVEFGMKAFFENGESPNGAIDIASNTNLNTLLNEGYYCIPNSSVSATITNKPFTNTSTALIKVCRTGDAGQKIQICMLTEKANGEIWERHYYQSAWGDWICITKGGGKVLWTGGYYMQASHEITLSEAVSKQANGIVLVFSYYSDGVVQDYNFNHFFVSKKFISLFDGKGSQFLLSSDGTFRAMASKYLYISDTTIKGNDNNTLSGTTNGITFDNKKFLLRYVIGI